DEIVPPQHFDSVVDLRQCAHARREDDRPAIVPMMPQQIVIGERSRSDLVAWRVEPLDEIDRRLVPTRGVPQDLLVAAIAVDGFRVALAKFQRTFQVAGRWSKRTFPRLRGL